MFQEQKINVAIYCRLSREDGDNQESSSIKTQKDILTEYANNNNWNIYKYYIDDGYSGGNFNRPAFKDLIDDIEDHKINILLTKDLSRLGRNYIEAGYYTEDYFPSKNVRYIAVNDNYDSIKPDNDLTPFKNIINQWYLKDLSKKIKSAHKNRMKKGVLQRGNILPIFGYQHTENNERIINPETAPTVRKVFELYNKGYGYAEIKKILYDLKLIVPSYYQYIKYGAKSSQWIDKPEDEKYKWSIKMIIRILTEIQYTGALAMNKSTVISYKTHKQVDLPKEEWIVYEDRFPAIISKEEFKKAQDLRTSRTKAPISFEENPYKNLVLCPGCGKPLPYFRLKGTTKYKARDIFKCQRRICTCRSETPMSVVSTFVNLEIPNFIKRILKYEDQLKEYARTYSKTKTTISTDDEETLKNLRNRIYKLDILIEKLFEKGVANELPQETYQKMMNSYKKEYQENKEKIALIEQSLKKSKTKDYEKYLDEFIQMIHEIKDKPITREVLEALIEGMVFKRKFKGSKDYSVKVIYKKVPDLLEDFFNGKK